MHTLKQALTLAARAFPMADPKVARKQGVKLLRAKHYLHDRGICAVTIGNKFEYSRATGSVLK